VVPFIKRVKSDDDIEKNCVYNPTVIPFLVYYDKTKKLYIWEGLRELDQYKHGSLDLLDK